MMPSKYHCVLQRVERSSAFVQRRVRLPESADMSKVKAAYTNGTLILDIPKAEVCLPCLLYVTPCASDAQCQPCTGRLLLTVPPATCSVGVFQGESISSLRLHCNCACI